MNRTKKIVASVVGGLALAAIVATLSMGNPGLVLAQGNKPPAQAGQNGDTTTTPTKTHDQYLATALGITDDALLTAQISAHTAAIDAALKAGDITEAQAKALRSGLSGGRGGLGGPNVDQQALLADALGITATKLQTAEEAASDAELAQAVTDGRIKQADADLRIGQRELQKYITEKDLYTSAVNAALKDGSLTQAQADAILAQIKSAKSGVGFPGLGGGMGGPGGMRGPGGMGGPGPGGQAPQ